MAVDYDSWTMGSSSPQTAEEALAVLEARARCVQAVLSALDTGIAGFVRSRSGLDWVGPAALEFSWAADHLVRQLREASSALDEALRRSRGAASAISAGIDG